MNSKLGKENFIYHFFKSCFSIKSYHTHSVNWSHSISKNRSSREHRVFNTNNLAILGNNIIIEGSFNHRILSMIEFREIDMISWNQGHQELYHNLFSSLHSTFCLFIWIFDAYFSLHSFSNLKIHLLLECFFCCIFSPNPKIFVDLGQIKAFFLQLVLTNEGAARARNPTDLVLARGDI